jgi:hypothetical protein
MHGSMGEEEEEKKNICLLTVRIGHIFQKGHEEEHNQN